MSESNGVAEVAEVLEAAPQVPAGPKKLEDNDRLKIENLFLKVENYRLQGERLQQDIVTCVQMRQKAQAEMHALQQELSAKYGCDFMKAKILPDGTIVPAQAG